MKEESVECRRYDLGENEDEEAAAQSKRALLIVVLRYVRIHTSDFIMVDCSKDFAWGNM